MKLGSTIVQNMFGVPYPVLALEHLWVPQIIIQRLKMLAPIVHIQTTKGARVLKVDMALQTCLNRYVRSLFPVCVRSAGENAHFQLTISGRVLVFASEILGNIFTHQNGNGKSIIPVQNWKILSGRNDSQYPLSKIFTAYLIRRCCCTFFSEDENGGCFYEIQGRKQSFYCKEIVLFINKSMNFLSLKGIFLLYEERLKIARYLRTPKWKIGSICLFLKVAFQITFIGKTKQL